MRIQRLNSLSYLFRTGVNVNSYPIRTSVKIFFKENNTFKNLCSGSIISKKHLLTARHCIAYSNSDSLKYDSIYVCPIYNNGSINSNFGCSYVSKVYILKDWSSTNEDMAILELVESIGMSTGWLAIGFDNSSSLYEDNIFYKFSYPNIYFPALDSFVYNGDTLYYNYGKVDLIQNWIGVYGATSIPGESGSSIIHVKNNQEYTSYGVLMGSTALRHSTFTSETFYPFKHIIKEEVIINNTDINYGSNGIIFPNPTIGYLNIKNLPNYKTINLTLFDSLGRTVWYKRNFNPIGGINILNLPNGNYYLRIAIDGTNEIVKIIKNGN